MKIRRYAESDKSACRKVCGETSFGITEDTDLKSLYVADCDYYLENAGESSFVAVNDYDEAIGYLLCAPDYKEFFERFKKDYLKKIIVAPDVLTRKLTEIWLYRKASKEYPAHMRIGVLPAGQRMGVGSALVKALSEDLKSKGISGVCAVCAKNNLKGNGFYKKYGFTEKKKFLGYTLYVLDV